MAKRYNGNPYLPEPVRFDALDLGEKVRVARLTAQFVARFATSYQAWLVTDRRTIQQGTLPRDRRRRASVIGEAFDQVEALLTLRGLPREWIGLILYYRKWLVLDQHDGIPARLYLTPEQFAQLQEYWQREGLPGDLYFPAEAERVVTEPIRMFGGLILGPGHYSPLQWDRRESIPPPGMSVPGEEERELAFIDAGIKFVGALGRRRAELTEPGRTSDDDELAAIRAIERLISSLLAAMAERMNRRRSQGGQHAEGGENCQTDLDL